MWHEAIGDNAGSSPIDRLTDLRLRSCETLPAHRDVHNCHMAYGRLSATFEGLTGSGSSAEATHRD